MLIVKLLHVKTNTKPKFTAQLSRSQDKLEEKEERDLQKL